MQSSVKAVVHPLGHVNLRSPKRDDGEAWTKLSSQTKRSARKTRQDNKENDDVGLVARSPRKLLSDRRRPMLASLAEKLTNETNSDLNLIPNDGPTIASSGNTFPPLPAFQKRSPKLLSSGPHLEFPPVSELAGTPVLDEISKRTIGFSDGCNLNVSPSASLHSSSNKAMKLSPHPKLRRKFFTKSCPSISIGMQTVSHLLSPPDSEERPGLAVWLQENSSDTSRTHHKSQETSPTLKVARFRQPGRSISSALSVNAINSQLPSMPKASSTNEPHGTPIPTCSSPLGPRVYTTVHGTISILKSKFILVDLREGERRRGKVGDTVLEVAPDGLMARPKAQSSASRCLTAP